MGYAANRGGVVARRNTPRDEAGGCEELGAIVEGRGARTGHPWRYTKQKTAGIRDYEKHEHCSPDATRKERAQG